jgi:hypothetical protein
MNILATPVKQTTVFVCVCVWVFFSKKKKSISHTKNGACYGMRLQVLNVKMLLLVLLGHTCDKLLTSNTVSVDVVVVQQVDDGKHGSADTRWEETLSRGQMVTVLRSLLFPC